MAAHDMNDALKHPHSYVTFSTIGDDTITALTTLAVLFKIRFKKPVAPEIIQSPIKAAENIRPAALVQPIITSPVKHNYHTRSQTEVNRTSPANVIESQNSPQLPRVVTPAARGAATPRVVARERNLSPRNLSQGDFFDMGSANNAIAFFNNHWNNVTMINAFLQPCTGKEMQYKDLMKKLTLGPLYKKVLGNELGRLFQGIRNIQGTNNCFFVELTNIPNDQKITYEKLLCDHKPHKSDT
jgi:hypothetical protein